MSVVRNVNGQTRNLDVDPVVHAVKAGLDAAGAIAGWQHTVVDRSILAGTAPEMMVKHGLDPNSLEGVAGTPYAGPRMRRLPFARPGRRMNRGARLRRCGAALLAVGGLGNALAAADADDVPSVTPYRPSVSTPAALSAPGWLELESGLLRVPGPGPARRDSVPTTLKLAFSPDWGVRIGGDAWVRQRDEDGSRRSGVGDTSIVLKRRFEVDERSAFGLELGATLPTGRSGIGSGKADYSVNAIYSADLGDYHTDLNLVSTRIGHVDPGEGRAQVLWAAALSRSLTPRWGAVAELSGTRQRGVDGTAQFLGAASYAVSKSLTLDAGLARSLRSAGPGWSAFAGFTLLVGRLF